MKLMTKLITVAVFACCLAACQGEKGESNSQTAQSQNADQLQTKFLTIGTGGASGPFNIIGTSLSELYAQKFGVNSKTQTTGASVENLNLIDQKKLEMAFVMNDSLNDAVAAEQRQADRRDRGKPGDPIVVKPVPWEANAKGNGAAKPAAAPASAPASQPAPAKQ